ncbi:MAG: hypothetical protein K0R21_219 [Anaerocolumna sp.]|jgi:hypothetical protein|nr:hypothetical protein [Anaerocolumna sp.]
MCVTIIISQNFHLVNNLHEFYHFIAFLSYLFAKQLNFYTNTLEHFKKSVLK